MLTILPNSINIFDYPSDAIVIPVNLIGVAGAGLAKQCKERHPDWYAQYNADCHQYLTIGSITTYYLVERDQYIINFPTKTHYKYDSELTYIEKGLVSLVEWILDKDIKESVQRLTLPALGCGCGKLQFKDVRNIIERHLCNLDIDVFLISPR
jgi:O-acetyl-ADP-ribose deacetylase (regulator of RNase III)